MPTEWRKNYLDEMWRNSPKQHTCAIFKLNNYTEQGRNRIRYNLLSVVKMREKCSIREVQELSIELHRESIIKYEIDEEITQN